MIEIHLSQVDSYKKDISLKLIGLYSRTDDLENIELEVNELEIL